jgi:hypothetical protein
MLYIVTFGLLPSGCGSDAPPVNYPPPEVSMAASAWAFEIALGVPKNPTQAGAGWEFKFPDCGGTNTCSVNYLTTASPALTVARTVRAKIATTGASSDKYIYKLKADNVCDVPATARFYFQRAGDTGQDEFGRWWAINGFVLGTGATTLTTDLLPENWSSVYGKRGDSSDTARQAFVAALTNAGRIGFTFGGGCFYGHGTNVLGEATFKAESYTTR